MCRFAVPPSGRGTYSFSSVSIAVIFVIVLLSVFKDNVKDTMLESKVQSYFIDQVKSRGLGLAVKVDCATRRGWPDVVFVALDGDICLIEFKQDGGRLTPHQYELHDELIALGADVLTIKGKAATDRLLTLLEAARKS